MASGPETTRRRQPGSGRMAAATERATGTIWDLGFARGQRDMQHRAALAVIQSAEGKGLTDEQRQLLAEAAEAILGLEAAALEALLHHPTKKVRS